MAFKESFGNQNKYPNLNEAEQIIDIDVDGSESEDDLHEVNLTITSD